MSIRSWWRGCKRRKPGVYLARTEKHRRAGRYENGYVGKSRHLALRQTCHEGTCRHQSCAAKPWMDLAPRWHALRLPWWLGWGWILGPLEVAAIVLLMPRYNAQHNRRNPRRVPISLQHRQRAYRDAGMYRGGRRLSPRWVDAGVRVAGLVCVLGGAAGWIITHR
ncbi:MAG: hypothetical protein JF597_01330 [Streptomyces sp.]|uniref:hypothetical protein n=1 Tax=Streptomyces sp. TaxID=1931 RepID=UPI0025D7440E|nr:hypothetical protein [Streptomyces sp.]MBW8792276.1 hypothetical protein [Streptomyces sp.]